MHCGAGIQVDGSMKTSNKISISQRLTSEIRLARLQVARAQSQHTAAKSRARVAKRRRRAARQAARRAKKKARQAKREVAEAKRALAAAQAKLARVRRRRAVAVSRRKAQKPAVAVSAKPVGRTRKVKSQPLKQVGLGVGQGPVGGTPGAPQSQVASPGQATPPAAAALQQS